MARSKTNQSDYVTLFAAALLVAIGGLIYELILGAAASYLLGDSILSFSLATGITLFGMGIGSLLATRITWHPVKSFAINELALGVIGGNSVLLLYMAFNFTQLHWVAFGGISLVIGVLIGMEIPLLVKLFQQLGRPSSAELLGKILALDYFGALIASLAFPLLLLPHLGLLRSAYVVAFLNSVVAILMLLQLKSSRPLLAGGIAIAVLLGGLGVWVYDIEHAIDRKVYRDPVILQQQSAYQKIVLTKYGDDLRLFLNNNLQFSSLDEARYHETLAGAALTSVPQPRRVLIMGGGDGLLAREVLRYPTVTHITLVDIDPAVTELARTHPAVSTLNRHALQDARVNIVNEDAFVFAFRTRQKYDAVLIDLVDPSNERLAKLYSRQFYQRVADIITSQGVMVTQATSSFFTPHAFGSVVATVRAAQPTTQVLPFSVNIPSFGEWGFVLATRMPQHIATQPLPAGLSYQTAARLQFSLLSQPATPPAGKVSTVLQPHIITAYTRDMRQWRY